MFPEFFTRGSTPLLIILISCAISIIQLNALPFNEAGHVLVKGVIDDAAPDAAVLRTIKARIDTIPNLEEDKYTFFKKPDSSRPKTATDSKQILGKLSLRVQSRGVDRHAPIYQIASKWKHMDISKNLEPLVEMILLCGSDAQQFTLRVKHLSASGTSFGTILVQKALSVLNDAELTQSERVWVHGLIDSLQMYCSSGLHLSAASSATPPLLRGELEHRTVSGAALQEWINLLAREPSSETPPTTQNEIVVSLERIELLKGIKEQINKGTVKTHLDLIHRLYDDILEDTNSRSSEPLILEKVRETTINILAKPEPGRAKEIAVRVLSHFMNYSNKFKSRMENVLGKDTNILSNYMDIKLRDIVNQLKSSGLDVESEWMTLARTFTLWDSGPDHQVFLSNFVDLIKDSNTDIKQKALIYQMLSTVSTYNRRTASKMEELYNGDPDFRRDVIQTWTHLYEDLHHDKVPYLSWEYKKLGSLDKQSLIEIETAQLTKSWGDVWGLQPLKRQVTDLSSGKIEAKEALFYTTTHYLSQGIVERDLRQPGPRDNLIAKPLERYNVEALAYLVSGDKVFERKLKDLMADQGVLKHRIISQLKKEVRDKSLPINFKEKKILPFYDWLTQSTIPNPLTMFTKSLDSKIFKSKSFKSLSFKSLRPKKPLDRQSTV